MTVEKNVSFRGAYVGRTFQTLARDLLGRDGYLEGAETRDDGVSITVGPYAFVESGIVCRQDAASTVPVPTTPEPWFVLAAAIDDDPASGVVLTATSDVSQAATGVVLAYKMNGRWSNPRPVSAAGPRGADGPRRGRESGLRPAPRIVPGPVGGVVNALTVGRGVAVDSRGERRELGANASGTATFAPYLQGVNDRNDYVVLRRREAGAELVLAQGGGIGVVDPDPDRGSVIATGPQVTRPMAVARRGGTLFEIGYAAGSGTSLLLAGSFDLSLSGGTSSGFFEPHPVYTGSGTVGNVIAVGLRASDRAILVVFTDGPRVKMGAFSSHDGAVVDAPVRLDAQPNACAHVSATLDGDGFVHVVYQHTESGAPPNQQVYYAKCSTASGRFGAAAVTPRLVNGIPSTKNDTWPSVGVDRHGRVHIAYATGNGSDEFGQLRYVVLDPGGIALERSTVVKAGHQPDPSASVLEDATGLVANIRRPQVVVTPHDEVDVLLIVEGAAGRDELGIFNPGFAARLGFPIVILSHLFPGSGAGTDTLEASGAVADDLGQLLVFASFGAAGLLYARLDTVLAPEGNLPESYLEPPVVVVATVPLGPELSVSLGAAGELFVGFVLGEEARVMPWPARTGGRAPSPHPNDVILSGWKVDAARGVLFEDPGRRVAETDLEVFSVRPRKMAYPILVGDDGDYQGYGSLHDALAVANRKGGHVVVRGGSHHLTAPLVLGSGVRLEGEGHVLLDFQIQHTPAAGLVQLGLLDAPLDCTVSERVVTVTASPPLRGIVRPGDLCELFDGAGLSTGLFRVRRVLDDARLVVDGQPSGVGLIVYACGVELSNVSVTLEPGGPAGLVSSFIAARGLYGGVLERVKLAGRIDSGRAGLRLWQCRETTVRNADVLGLTGGVGSYGIWLTDGSDNAVERALIGDADGTALRVHSSEMNPLLSDCGSSRPTAPATIVLDGPRTTPAFLSGCTARVDGDVVHAVTPVGKRLSAVSGKSGPAGALQLEDENTLIYGGAPLDLTAPSAAGAAFNGASPHVLVPSVNERLRRTGDAMTGELGVPSLLLAEVAVQPAPPPAGAVRLYLRSNGAAPGQSPPQHRSQLVMLMPSGQTLLVAQTEPT